jgi:hypothetical protein
MTAYCLVVIKRYLLSISGAVLLIGCINSASNLSWQIIGGKLPAAYVLGIQK